MKMYKDTNRNKRNNALSENQYIISPHLHELLEQEGINENKFIDKKDNGIYLVMFRVLNRNTNVLIYNYIYYNPLFLECLVFYFIFRVEFSSEIGLNEGNDYLVILDFNFAGKEDKEKNKLSLNKNNRYLKNLLDYIVSSDYGLEGLFFRINKLILLGNYEEMSSIIKLAYEKEYIKFINLILSNIENYKLLPESLQNHYMMEDKSLNMINSCLFIVKNLDFFIDDVKKKGYIVNGGPQRWRSQLNSMSSFLSCLDYDFRNSLYNHNRYHVHHENIDKKFLLDKNKFSFNNIHMNLGKVRWYSTAVKKDKNGYLSYCQEISLTCLDSINWFYLNKEGFINSTDSLSLPNILENKAGIYIYQLLSDKSTIFLGSTFNIPGRLLQHRYCANNNINACPQFYNSVKKYGWPNFRLGILEYIDMSERSFNNRIEIRKILLSKEQSYLSIMDSTLNINKLPITLIGRKQVKEMSRVMKLFHKNNK